MASPLIPQKPRAVIFDWDDTIVDTWTVATQALAETLQAMGHAVWTEEEMRAKAGPSARDMFMQMFGDRWQDADRIYYDAYHRLHGGKTALLSGVAGTLEYLRRKGVYLAVASNKRGEYLREEAARAGLAGHFSRIVGAGDAEKDKPDPAPLYLALADSGIVPDTSVWYVGDAHTDMMCAYSAGCAGILIETKPPPNELLFKNPPAQRVRNHGHFMEFIDPYFT